MPIDQLGLTDTALYTLRGDVYKAMLLPQTRAASEQAIAADTAPINKQAVADVWDALRSDRPYRPAWPADTVREHIRSLAGTHFDPRVVQVALDLGALGE